VLASSGASGFVGSDFSYMDPVIRAVRSGDLTLAANAWADTPLMAIPTDSAAWALVRRISLDNRSLWGIRANPERPLVPPAIGRLAEVRTHVLVISGEKDLPDMRRAADTLAKTIPGAQSVVIAGVGHMANLAAPEEFNRAMLAFLREQPE
jgi:3-oxoadipate enol-lactonase